MAAQPNTADLYLSYLDVLDEEDQALGGREREELQQLRAAYSEARTNRNRTYQRTEDQAARDEADALVVDAERKFREELFWTLHSRERSALSFSGGGIRSATFGLGLLQGLAACSRCTDGQRPKLLGEFDYLSTVSGGGYLGAWFSAWAARLANPHTKRLRDCNTVEEQDGPGKVIEELAKSPDAGFEPEPEEVKHLRAYSNYLAPKVGLFSADTWTLFAIVIRNMALNWLVLLPLFAAGLLLPVLAWRLLWLQPAVVNKNTLWYLITTAFVLGCFSVAYVGYDLPNAGNARRSAKMFLLACLTPLSIAAIHLSIFWAWLPHGGPAAWWDVVGLGKQGVTWWHFAVFGAAMHGGGMLAGIAYVSFRYNRPPRRTGLAATVAATVTGFIGGLVAYALSHLSNADAAGHLSRPRLYAILAFPVVMGVFWFSGMLLVGAGSYITEDEDREWWARSGGWIIAVATAWLFFAFVVLYSMKALPWVDERLSAGFTAITGLTGWVAARAGKSPDTDSGRTEAAPSNTGKLLSSKSVKEYGARLLLPIFITLLAILLGAADLKLVHAVGQLPNLIPSFWPSLVRPMGDITAHALWVLLACVVLCLVASYFININKFSLHGMYRMRLIRAYLGASNTARQPNMFTGFDPDDNVAMCSLTKHKPLHIVNMALNLVHGSNLAWQQRKAESFTSTRLHTGSCRVGYRSSAKFGGLYKEGGKRTPISLGTAMTISGAAASPNMGYHSSPLLTLVMTLFNARLGWWLGNPKSPETIWSRPGPRWGIQPFVDEAFGLTDDSNEWLYLSDGGHFENLGIYELVLRRCHLIVVSDAGADPKYTYEDMANAVRKVRIDLGIPIHFVRRLALTPPDRRGEGELGGHHCGIATIGYGAVDKGAPDGILLYIKASLNGNETPDILHYAATNDSFPQQPTSDQFYDEAQFESYRRLGLHIIEEICGPDYGKPEGLDLAEFVRLADKYCKLAVPERVGATPTEQLQEELQVAAKAGS